MAVFTGALAVITVALAAHRDLGAATLPDRTSARPRTRLLGNPMGLAVRLRASDGRGLGGGRRRARAALRRRRRVGRAGDHELPDDRSHLGKLGAPGGRCDGIPRRDLSHGGAARGPDRRRAAWSSARRRGPGQARGTCSCDLCRARTGWRKAPAWPWPSAGERPAGRPLRLAGSRSQHTGVRLGSLLAAGLNVVPPALCILGIGVLVLGLRPRAATPVAYGLLAWSLLVEVLGGTRARATGCSTLRCSTRCRPRRPWRPVGRAPRHSPPWARSPRRSAVSPSCAAIWPGSEWERGGGAWPPPPRPPRRVRAALLQACSAETMLPAGSLNQAIAGPPPWGGRDAALIVLEALVAFEAHALWRPARRPCGARSSTAKFSTVNVAAW